MYTLCFFFFYIMLLTPQSFPNLPHGMMSSAVHAIKTFVKKRILHEHFISFPTVRLFSLEEKIGIYQKSNFSDVQNQLHMVLSLARQAVTLSPNFDCLSSKLKS